MVKAFFTCNHKPLFLMALCSLAICIAGCGGMKSGVIDNTDYADPPNPFVTPSNFRVVEQTAGTYTAEWDAMPGSAYYVLVKSGSAVEAFTLTETTYDDDAVASNVSYYYVIKACTNSVCGWESGSFPVITIPLQVSASQSGDGLYISWTGLTNATKYIVYRNCGEASETALTSTEAGYTDTNLEPATLYNYCVTACFNDTCTAKSALTSATPGSG
jgi:hypothetical protein